MFDKKILFDVRCFILFDDVAIDVGIRIIMDEKTISDAGKQATEEKFGVDPVDSAMGGSDWGNWFKE